LLAPGMPAQAQPQKPVTGPAADAN
jgi:hypothetical protein